MAKYLWVYIMASANGVLYVGVTNDLGRRVWEHKHGSVDGFTKKYRVTKLVYFEQTTPPSAAIAREKQIKKWSRDKKVALIEATKPNREDLARNWYDEEGAG